MEFGYSATIVSTLGPPENSSTSDFLGDRGKNGSLGFCSQFYLEDSWFFPLQEGFFLPYPSCLLVYVQINQGEMSFFRTEVNDAATLI